MMLWILSLFLTVAQAAEPTGSFRVTVAPLHADTEGRWGVLRILVCANSQCYNTEGRSSAYLNIPGSGFPEVERVIPDQPVTFDFAAVEPGDYSVFIHHDRNEDGEVLSDTCTVFKKPRDGIGFSNNCDPRVTWTKPRWKEVKFRVDAGRRTDLQIKPIYMCD